MAGRVGKSGEPKSKSSRVEDGELFPFAADSLNSGSVPSLNIARTKTKTEKSHYHEHRARPRQRFDEAGAVALSNYELLELLLARFGTLAAVFAAPVRRIAEVDGAGPAVAQDLKTAQALFERASKAEFKDRTVISSWSQPVNYCRLAMAHEPREQFRVQFLHAKNQLIADEIMNRGTVDHAPIYPREVIRRALDVSAAAIILVHNHPSGDPKPSAADIAITREIVDAADAISVKVHDHLVVGRKRVESFRSLGLL